MPRGDPLHAKTNDNRGIPLSNISLHHLPRGRTNHEATLIDAERNPKGDLSLIFGSGAEAQLALGQLGDSNE
jgi:hypothetical protein